jgi:hypothetical protein
MPFIDESNNQRNNRMRTGRIVALACITWWVLSIGGIILVINTTA